MLSSGVGADSRIKGLLFESDDSQLIHYAKSISFHGLPQMGLSHSCFSLFGLPLGVGRRVWHLAPPWEYKLFPETRGTIIPDPQ